MRYSRDQLLGIGVGYSSDKMMVTGINCLKDYKITLIGFPDSIVTFGDARSGSKIAQDLGVSLSASYMIFPMIIASASVDYAKYVQDSSYSQTFNFIYQIELGSQVLNINQYNIDTLNDFGLAAYNAGLVHFREACGDQFIVQQSIGARLYVTMKLTFSNARDKTFFALSLGGKADLLLLVIDVQLKYKQIVEEQNINLNLEIAAYQSGGDVVRLANIFRKNPNGTFYAMDCDIRDMTSCEEVLGDILNYAKLHFMNQISYNGTGYPAVIGNIYMPYTQLGLASSNSSVTPVISETRWAMLQAYANLTQGKAFLENLLYKSQFQNMKNSTQIGYKQFDVDLSTVVNNYKYNNITQGYWTWSPNQIFTAMSFSLSKLLSNIESNILLLESKDVGIWKCYSNPKECSIPNLAPVDYTVIDMFKTAYQLITVCGAAAYGRYLMPVDNSIYQEQAKFSIGSSTVYLQNIYLINTTNPITKEISISIIDDEFAADAIPCAESEPNPQFSEVNIYEVQLTGACANKICPNSSNTTYAVFIEVDSPI